MAKVEISVAGLTDRKRLSELSILGNLDNAYGEVVWRGTPTEERIKGSYARFPSKLLAEGAWFMKLEKDGVTIATAEWELPSELWTGEERLREAHPLHVTVEQQKQFQQEYAASVDADDWPLGAQRDAANAVGPVMSEGRKMFPQDGNYIVLDQLKTMPEHRRQGAATKLLQWGLDLADREALPICLVAWPKAVELYERHGFRRLHQVQLDLSRFGGSGEFCWVFMIRDARAGSGRREG